MSTFWFSRNSRNGIVSSLSQRTGFSAVEGLVVLGLISMMAGLSVPLYRTYQIRSDLNLATEHIVQSLARAQSLAQSGQNDMPWGVYVQEGTLFAGETYVFRDQSQDEVFVIPSTIDASGLEEVVYTRLEGLPVETGTIILTALNGEYREIIIDDFGRISVGDLQSPPVFPGGTAGDDGGVGGETAGSEGGDDGGTDATGGSGGTDDDDGGDTGTAGTAGDDGGSEGGTDGGTDGGSTGDTAGDDGGSDTGGGGDDEEEDVGECGSTFSVQGDDVKTVGTVDLTLKVLGSEITYGAGGPPVQVRLAASMDDGDTWSDLFGGNPVSTNDTVTFENLPEGTPVSLRFNGRYSWLFNKTYRSDDSDGHVLILRDGDKPPNYKPFANQSSLASFLRSILDDKGRIDIGSRDLVFLTELGTLDQNADFQDAVVLATFTQKALTCSPSTEPRVKISFQRLQNSGNGDVKNKVFVGTQGTAFAEEQWIPLTSNGQVIVDGGLKETVKGLAIERGPGWIRVLNRGAHISSQSKELLDARVLFNKAYITSVVNDEGANASENPTDGVVNDGPDGDEFIGGPNEKSMVFASRVSSDKDAVILYWTTGNPPSGQGQQESSDPSDETDTATDESDETDDNDDDANDQETAIDPCAVPFTVHEDGRITLGGDADVSVRVAGSESTYGYRGPRVQVRSQIRIGNGSFEPLFGYRSLKGGEIVTFSDRSEGSDIALEFNGRYTWLFSSTARSGESDARVRVLTKGQHAPTVPLINARTSLKSFLRNILTTEGTMNVTNRQVAVLVELGELNNTADYQDAVLILSIDKPASEGRCGSSASDDTSDDEASEGAGSDQDDEDGEGGETSGDDDDSSGDTDPNGDSDGDNVANASDLCPGTFMPESVPTEQMLFNRYALTAKSPIFRVGPRKRVSQYSLSDTHGCSCGQVLDAIEGRGIHRLNEYPVLFRTLQGLFSFYVRSSRQFGCGEALMEIVSQRR